MQGQYPERVAMFLVIQRLSAFAVLIITRADVYGDDANAEERGQKKQVDHK
jgi:hypothetical protein